MIGVIFKLGAEVIEVRVQDINIYFRTSQLQTFADIEGIRLQKSGVIKEFPELKDNEDWRRIATKRFKEKIKKMNSEKERVKYIIEDLSKHGYVPMSMQQSGHRVIKLNKTKNG